MFTLCKCGLLNKLKKIVSYCLPSWSLSSQQNSPCPSPSPTPPGHKSSDITNDYPHDIRSQSVTPICSIITLAIMMSALCPPKYGSKTLEICKSKPREDVSMRQHNREGERRLYLSPSDLGLKVHNNLYLVDL